MGFYSLRGTSRARHKESSLEQRYEVILPSSNNQVQAPPKVEGLCKPDSSTTQMANGSV
ncbi:MAG TPA: hypothetical protein VIO64_02620 [Pseudobacteroides sp.]|uniref:hypothetical protein n=1 Tax=Pseudobacteroides sp. TaxID=1968840 RepID=UPI002F94C774